MKKEVETFKEAREKLVADRDEKIKELEDTKNKKLNESKQNIEEKIETLKTENDSFKKQLPIMKKDYNNHKNESKKLFTIIEANNKKKKEYKDQITQLNSQIFKLKGETKEKQILVYNLNEYATGKKNSLELLKAQLEQVTKECNEIQKQLTKKD
jgi:chromosome segregation ATPase